MRPLVRKPPTSYQPDRNGNWENNRELDLIKDTEGKALWLDKILEKNKKDTSLFGASGVNKSLKQFTYEDFYAIKTDSGQTIQEIEDMEIAITDKDRNYMNYSCVAYDTVLQMLWGELDNERGTDRGKTIKNRKDKAVQIWDVIYLFDKQKEGKQLPGFNTTQFTGNLSGNYKNAKKDLFENFGNFCAYCGTIVDSASDVEHMLPKSDFPLQALEWDNFLIACKACNTKKSDNPSRLDAVAAIIEQERPLTNTSTPWPTIKSEDEILKAAKDLWLWPTDTNYEKSEDVFTYVLCEVEYDTNGKRTKDINLEELDPTLFHRWADPKEERDKFTIIDETVRIKIKFFQQIPPVPPATDPTWEERTIQVELLVKITNNPSPMPNVKPKAQRVIDNCNINRTDLEISTQSDLRIPRRTYYWLSNLQKVILFSKKLMLLEKHFKSDMGLLKNYVKLELESLTLDKTPYWSEIMDAYKKGKLFEFIRGIFWQSDPGKDEYKPLMNKHFYDKMPGTKPFK